MKSPSLSPATWRAVRLADQFRQQSAELDLTPEHLLWALVAGDARASVYLNEHGLNHSEVPFQLEQLPDRNHSESPTTTADTSESLLPGDNDEIQMVLQQARSLARNSWSGGEVCTEHLLIACQRVSRRVTGILAEHGLSPTDLERLIHETHAESIAPIEIEPILVGSDQAMDSPPIAQARASHPEPGDAEHDIRCVWRILDASGNRAREGLRVIEDSVRFALDNQQVTRQLKTVRHQVAAALGLLNPHQLIAARNTEQDVGTSITTDREYSRPTLNAIIIANFKRAQEALRSLEEYSKLINVTAAKMFEQSRYALYTIEKSVTARFNSPGKSAGSSRPYELKDVTKPTDTGDLATVRPDSPLYLLLTSGSCRKPWQDVLAAFAESGGRIVQLREKQLDVPELVALGRSVREVCRDLGLTFIVNDRPDIAVAVNASGVHLGQGDLDPHSARAILGLGAVIGLSTHTIEQVHAAIEQHVDYIGVGPVFPSRTKAFSEFAGLEFVQQVAELNPPIPWYPIGGISLENIELLTNRGVQRVAVSHAICSAEDPAGIGRQLISKLRAGPALQ